MGTPLFLLFFSSVAFANEPLSPAVDNISKLYGPNKKIIEICLNRRPSHNKSLGCVDSLKYINAVCDVKREINFKKRYKNIARSYFDEACKLSERAEGHLSAFIELDAKGCIYGYETLPDRIMTLSKNKEVFEEKDFYMSEKNACKEFRTYVNLCNYVDGDLKEILPTDYFSLPKLDFSKNTGDVCKPTNSSVDGLYTLNHDLVALTGNSENKIYERLILDYRSRMPASKKSPFPVCEKVRTSYGNLGCARFEKLKDGDPIYYSSDEIRQFKIQDGSRGSSTKGSN